MTYPASIAQSTTTSSPTPFPGPYQPDLFTFLFFLVGIILALIIWPQDSGADASAAAAALVSSSASTQPAQQPCQENPESVYPPGMEIDLVQKGWVRSKAEDRGARPLGARSMAEEGRRVGRGGEVCDQDLNA